MVRAKLPPPCFLPQIVLVVVVVRSRPFHDGTGEIPPPLLPSPIVLVVVVVLRSRPFPSGPSETPASSFSLFLLSYVQPCNRPQSVIDHEDDDDDEDDYKDED